VSFILVLIVTPGQGIRKLLVESAQDKADARSARLCDRQGWAFQRRAEFELAAQGFGLRLGNDD
jgi:hypothetical protein